MFNLKNVGAQSANVHSMILKDSNNAIVNALLSQILLSFKFKIIKFEKIRAYKNQSENQYQR